MTMLNDFDAMMALVYKYGQSQDAADLIERNKAIAAFRTALLPAQRGEGGVDDRLGCIDCGEQYGSPRFPDLVIDNMAFAAIAPNPPDGGLICPNCINARLTAAGITNVQARFTSGPMASDATITSTVERK